MQLESALLFETPEEICRRVHRLLIPDAEPPAIRLEFCRFANVRSVIRLRDGVLHLRISDLLEQAPAPILEALCFLLIAKLYRRPVPSAYRQRLRLYLRRSDVSRDAHLLRALRGQKFLSGPTGNHVCLEELFKELNEKYFHNTLPVCRLGWSRRLSRTRLGHYDPAHNTIILSRFLDLPGTPRQVVEYVLFHEMLHLQFPVEQDARTGRRRVHSRAFREAEKRFPHLQEVKAWLKGTAR